MTSNPTVLVVDFGAQYAQLIARRVREANVYSEIVAHDLAAAEYAAMEPAGIIFSGGPASVNIDGAPRIDPGIYDLGIPILGICYGAQLIAKQLGGTVSRFEAGEYGRTDMDVSGGRLLEGQPAEQTVWMSHFDCISEAPAGFDVVASTVNAPVAAFESDLICGVQYHPEVSHTPHGQAVIERWLDVSGIERTWTMANVIDEQVELIRAQVGDGRAICGLSGGVDSAVAAALVHKAIGHQLTCVFVDTGLMRKNEGAQVVETFQKTQGIELIHVRAGDEFFAKLAGSPSPRPSARRSASCSSACSSAPRAASRTPTSWCRGRSTRT